MLMIDSYFINDNLDSCQELQNVYAELTGLFIFITNDEGHLLSTPSDVEIDALFTTYPKELESMLKTEIDKLKGLRVTALSDQWIPGIKWIISPVSIDQQPIEMYIWAGIMIQENTRHTIIDHVNYNSPDVNGPAEIFRIMRERIQVIQEDDIQQIEYKKDKINKLSKAIALILKSGYKEKKFAERLTTLNETLRSDSSRNLPIEEVTRAVLASSDLADVFGFALKTSSGTYRIVSSTGPAAAELKGAIFHEGEGFLGQAVLSEQLSHWRDVGRDPRSHFFLQKGLASIYEVQCFPIRYDDENYGLLFGIGLEEKLSTNSNIRFEETLISLIGWYIGNHITHSRMEKQIQRFKPLMELASVMVSVQDIQRVLFMLVDMSLNLVWSPSASIVVHRASEDEKVQMVARGMESPHGETYARDIARRYLENGNNQPATHSYLNRAVPSSLMIEYPIVYADKTRAVLAVAIGDEQEGEECREILSALATMGSVIMKLLYDRQQFLSNSNRFAHILHESIREWNVAQYQLATDAQKIVMEFALWGGLRKDEGETIARACLMSFADPTTLRSFPHLFEQEAEMIEDFKQIQQNQNSSASHAYSKGGQTMVLVFALAASGDNDIQLMNDAQFTNIDPSLISQFRLFMLSRHTLQTEISLMEEKPIPRAITAEVAEGRGLEAIVKEFGLSPREKEVLELVVKASSNKEIAAALFISEHTVKNHLTNIFNKMSVTDRAQAIAAVFNKSIG